MNINREWSIPPMTETLIRLATIDDLDFIYNSYHSTTEEQGIAHRFHHTKESLGHALFQDQLAHVLIAEQNQKPVGFTFFSLTQRNFTLFLKPGLYVHTLYVTPSHRRQKIATKLMAEVKKIGQENGCGRIDLVVFKTNIHALNLLKKDFGAQEVDNINYMRIGLV
jgi:ribosomal protein S18 acetylase RimI-like enzyme